MAKVVLLMITPYAVGDIMCKPTEEQSRLALAYLAEGNVYMAKLMADSDDSVEDIAEEMFDLTNNPSRQEEREEKYGRGRSLSVGDIVQVGGTMMLCCSFGWKTL